MQQYSSIGLTRERYAAVFVHSLQTFKFLLRKPNILFPFLIVWSMCLFQDMLDCSSTPRYRVESSVASVCPFNEYSLTTVLYLDTLMVLHLSGWKDIPHFFTQDASLSRSSCRMSQSLWLAHPSRRLIGELIGYSWSGVRPS